MVLGDPLSGTIFILCIELLANVIRNNNELIDGIEDKVTKFIKTINLHCDENRKIMEFLIWQNEFY